MNKYIKKNGETSIYNQKKYDLKRNKTIYNLQKRKSYYKKIGNEEKVKACEILINIEKNKTKK